MFTIGELEEQQRAHLLAAKGLCDAAESEGRDFTPAEREQVSHHLDEARKAKSEAERRKDLEGGPELKRRLDELNALASGSGHYAGGWQSGGVWSKKVVEHLQRMGPHGAKELMTPTGAVSVPGVISTVVPLGDRVETILQLIPSEQTFTDAVAYLQETTRTHNAAPVAVGDKKPTSVYTVERVDDRARVIAHLSEPIPRQYLADIPMLRQYIDGALREGTILELETQVIQGSGAGENLRGILATPQIQEQAWDTNMLVTCRKAITDLELVSIAPSAFVLHPQDWETIELATDLTAQFQMKADTQQVPVDRARRRLWGLPVALSLGCPQGIGIVADFLGSTKLWEREGMTLDWSEGFFVPADAYDAEGSTGFQRNMLQFRCEGRWCFAVLRPRGVVQIDLTAGS